MGMVFYNAMLPDLVPRARLGRTSGWGWGVGYFGGLTCLGTALLLLVQAETPILGLDKQAAEHLRATGPMVALWYAVFSLPLFLLTPDKESSGIGYTAAAALAMMPERSSLVIAELVPAVVEWNRGPLGPLAGHPLDDPRTELVVDDVVRVIQDASEEFDAMLLDVDNGPTALTDRGNSWLYTKAGLKAIRRALRPGGSAAIWSVGDEPSFERRLREVGLRPSTHRIRAHGRRGTQHLVFVGKKPGPSDE